MVVATRRATGARPPPPPPDLASHPPEEELITSFLRPRLAGGAPPRAFVHDADVYSAGPDELTRGFRPAVAGNGDRAWYFFSAVRAKARDGQRRARTVGAGGGGCWHAEAGARPVLDAAGRFLGHRRSFSFVTRADGGRRVRSGWLMVELGLDDADGVALCKIYFSPRARANPGAAASAAAAAGRKRKPAAADDDPAAPARQRRSTEEAGTPRDDAEGKDSTQAGGVLADEGSASVDDEDEDGLWKEGMFVSWWMRNRDRLMEEYGIVDRSDEELQKTLGLDKVMKLLNRERGDSLLFKPWAPAGNRP